MKKISFLLGLLTLMTACAGTEADLERARYLLGRGGVKNAEEALSIVSPMVAEGASSGAERIEAFRLYAGAQMSAAGFDSTSIIAAMLYSDDDKILKSISGASGDVEDATTQERLEDAADKLSLLVNEDDFADASVRSREGIYFQVGLVQFLRGLRVFLNLSGLGETETFDITACEQVFAPVVGNLTNPDSPSFGLAQVDASESTLKDEEKANLDPDNDLVSNIRQLSGQLTPIINDAEEVCKYLEKQQ